LFCRLPKRIKDMNSFFVAVAIQLLLIQLSSQLSVQITGEQKPATQGKVR